MILNKPRMLIILKVNIKLRMEAYNVYFMNKELIVLLKNFPVFEPFSPFILMWDTLFFFHNNVYVFLAAFEIKLFTCELGRLAVN